MAIIQSIGQSSGNRKSYSGGRVIAPLSDFNSPILEKNKPKTSSKPTVVSKQNDLISKQDPKKVVGYINGKAYNFAGDFIDDPKKGTGDKKGFDRVKADIKQTVSNIKDFSLSRSKDKIVEDAKGAKESTRANVRKLKLEDVDLKRGWEFVKEGSRQLPSQLKQGAGVMYQGIVDMQNKMDDFYRGAPKFLKPILGATPIGMNAVAEDLNPFKEQAQAQEDKAVAYAKNLREEGFEESQRLREEFAQKYPEQAEGLQKYIELVAYNLPQVATTTGLTIATAVVTKNPYLAGTVGVSTSYGLGASEVYNEARSFGLSDSEALPLAEWGGAIIGALEYLPLGRLVSKSGADDVIKKSLIKKIAGGIVSVGTQSGFEGLTEGMQEIVGNAISQTYNENQDLFEGADEATIVGIILGGLADVTVSGVVGVTGGSGTQTDPEVQKVIDYKNETRPQVEELAQKIQSGEITTDDLLAQVESGELNQDILQRVNEKTQGLELLTQFNEARESGNIAKARRIAQEIMNAPDDAPISQYKNTVEGFVSENPETSIMEVAENIETNISDAIETKPSERTAEQQEIVDTLFTQELTPDQAIAFVVNQELDGTSEGKFLIQQASEAKKTDQLIEVKLNENEKSLEISLVSPQETRVVREIPEDLKPNQPSTRDNAEEGTLPSDQDGSVDPEVQGETKEDIGRLEKSRLFQKSKEFSQELVDQAQNLSEFKKGDVVYDVYVGETFTVGNSKRGGLVEITSEDGTVSTTNENNNPHYVSVADAEKVRKKKKGRVGETKAKPKKKKTETKKKVGETKKKQGTSKKSNLPKKKTSKKKFRAKSVPRQQLPQGSGDKKVSRLEARVRKVLNNTTQEQQETLGVATYKQLNKEANIKKAVEFVQNNPEDAMKVLTGDIDAPKGILRNSIYIAMEQLSQGDLALARRLASLQSTRYGQEISILTELDPNSAVKLMRDIIQIREKSFSKRYKNRKISDVRKGVTEQIDSKIKKPSKNQWNSFLETIKC